MADSDFATNDSAGQKPIYNLFKSNFTRKHEYGELIAHDAIGKLFPDKHITPVLDHDAKPFEYAEAGHAKAKLLRDEDDYLALRSYSSPVTRMEAGDGKLDEVILFGLYEYEHRGNSFRILCAQWYTQYSYGTMEKMNFILTPKSDVDAQSHSNIADQLIILAGKWTAQLHDEVYVFDQSQWSKDKALWAAVQTSSWDDVILDPDMKANIIRDVTAFFDSRAVYEEYNVPWKRGLILHGTPGCGKTITIKALMKSLQSRNVVSLYVKTLKGCSGEQSSIRQIFAKARIMAPCMLIFEDLDSMINDKVRSYFLNEVDGVQQNDGILMIGSSNHLDRLDPAISKRPSRFDRKYHYRLPSEASRIAYCNYWRQKLEKNGHNEFHDDIASVLAQLTEGFSFAYLKELFVQTLLAIVGGLADRDDGNEDEDCDHFSGAAKDFEPLEANGTAAVEDPPYETKENARSREITSARQMPEVIIPKHLQKNTLMRVLHKQAKVLWREMDNTTD